MPWRTTGRALIVFVGALGLLGCGCEGEQEATPAVSAEPAPATDKTTAALEDPNATLHQQAAEAVDAEKYEDAIKLYASLIDGNVDDAIAYFGRGTAYSAQGDHDRAIADFDEVIRIDPKAAQAFYVRAISWAQKNEVDRAIADCTSAIELDAKQRGAYELRAELWTKKGEPEKAEKDKAAAAELPAPASAPTP